MSKKTYVVYKEGRLLKEYPFKLQAYIYCALHGYIHWDTDTHQKMFLDRRIEIVPRKYLNIS